jgi:hypothetical protein
MPKINIYLGLDALAAPIQPSLPRHEALLPPRLTQGKRLWTEAQKENQYRHPTDYISFFIQGRIVYGFGMVNPQKSSD